MRNINSTKILVTGGAGYIGSHACVELLENGYEVIVIDNLANSSERSLEKVQKITGKTLTFHNVDLLDNYKLNSLFNETPIEAVLHFAGLKAVDVSVKFPLLYYENNLRSTINLLNAMKNHGVKKLIFSSSAAVYGIPQQIPINEDHQVKPINPYGYTKLVIEQMCQDLVVSDSSWKIISLRYFNVVGAHPNAEIGEDIKGIPNNLMPFVLQVAVGRYSQVKVFGNNYPTPDGTGVRDYIHVVDLAQSHVFALKHLDSIEGFDVFNIGTGRGYSVLEIINMVSEVVGKQIPYEIVEPRWGDVSECYAGPRKAAEKLGWKATRGVSEMCADAWRWHRKNFRVFN